MTKPVSRGPRNGSNPSSLRIAPGLQIPHPAITSLRPAREKRQRQRQETGPRGRSRTFQARLLHCKLNPNPNCTNRQTKRERERESHTQTQTQSASESARESKGAELESADRFEVGRVEGVGVEGSKLGNGVEERLEVVPHGGLSSYSRCLIVNQSNPSDNSARAPSLRDRSPGACRGPIGRPR